MLATTGAALALLYPASAAIALAGGAVGALVTRLVNGSTPTGRSSRRPTAAVGSERLRDAAGRASLDKR